MQRLLDNLDRIELESQRQLQVDQLHKGWRILSGNLQLSEPIGNTELDDIVSKQSEFFKNQRWNGGSDTYRPEKRAQFDSQAKWRSYLMLFLAAGPVLISILFASVLIWKTPPYGFNCRSIMFSGIEVSWLISAWLSHTIWRRGRFSRKSH
jgi:hypothetical protein